MATMKTLCGVRVGNMKDPDPDKRGLIDFVDLPFPDELDDHEVLIKVAYCAICGSDPHAIGGIFGQPQGSTEPIPLGHECSGVIEKVGAKVAKDLKVGDRVAGNFISFCGGCVNCLNEKQQFCSNVYKGGPGMAKYMVWHEDQVLKIPDSMPLKTACLLEPTAIAVRMMDKCKIRIGDSVCIAGGGPIGQLALMLANIYGATNLTMIEPVDARLEVAKKNGAVHTINPIKEDAIARMKEITGGEGFDVVLDCSGSTHITEVLPELCHNGGTLIYGAQYPNEYNMPFPINKYLYFKELTISGVFVAPYAFPRALQILQRIPAEILTDTVFPLDDAINGFYEHLSGKHLKVLINCNEDLKDL